MRYSLVFIAILLFVSCKKKESYEQVKILGHAGNGLNIQNSVYHDNSLEAVDLALSMNGCDGVEVDVQLSKDGTLWLFHDAEMSHESSVSGCINSKTDSELEEIDYRSVHSGNLCRLNALDFNYLNGKTILLDLRYYNACEEKLFLLDSMLSKLEMFKNLCNSSNVTVFAITNYENWVNPLILSGFEVIYSGQTIEEVKTVNSGHNLAGILMKNPVIKSEDVDFFKSQGKKVFIFEVRSPKGIRSALKKKPDYLLTDDIRATLIEKYR